MSDTDVLEKPGIKPTDTDDTNDPDHVYCCDEDWAICGLWIGDQGFAEDLTEPNGNTCPLCALAWNAICERCGQ